MADIVVTSTTESEDEIRAAHTEKPEPSPAPAPEPAPAPAPEPEPEAERSGRAERKRFAKMNARMEALLEANQQQREMIDKLLAGRHPPEAEKNGLPANAPLLKDFATAEEWAHALLKWDRTESETKAAGQRQAEEMQQQYEEFESARAAYAAEHPDYEEIIADGMRNPVRVPEITAVAIFAAENGPAVQHYILTHPEALEAIRTMPENRIPLYIGQLDAAVGRPVKRAVSSAPEPITPLERGSAAVSRRLDDPGMSMREYRAARKQGRQF